MLKYKCLVLDHDDTVVKSTPAIHFPAFMNTLSVLRPGMELSFEQFVRYCFDPGFNELCFQILGFSREEMELQVSNWKNYVSTHIPEFYEGFADIIRRQKKEGGYVCVVSHSYSENIVRDYLSHKAPVPDLTFGWELPEEKRKPSPYPLLTIMERLKLSPRELLVVDDLKPGLEMARSAGVDFAYAGWSCSVPEILKYMSEASDFSFSTPSALKNFLF